MANPSAKGSGFNLKKIAIIVIIIAVICIAAFAGFVSYTLSSALRNAKPVQTSNSMSMPGVNASLVSQNLLSYNNETFLLPYSLFSYTAYNSSSVGINVTLFKSKPPSRIYLLNTTASVECFHCGSIADIENAFVSRLISYGVINNSSGVSQVYVPSVTSLPNDSIVLILSGLMPSQLLNASVNNVTPLQRMLRKGMSIIYVGQDFSRVLLPGPIVTYQNLTGLPFLHTMRLGYATTNGFFFNKSTFAFANGTVVGSITYTNVLNGSIVAFSNISSSWASSSDTGNDLAKAVQELFWLPKYSAGYTVTATANGQKSSGKLGLIESNISTNSVASSRTTVALLNSGYGRAVVSANSTIGKNTIYQYIFFKPSVSINGTMALPKSVVPAQSTQVVMAVFTNSKVPVSITPYLSVFTLNMSRVISIGLPWTSASNGAQRIIYPSFNVGPGRYLLTLNSFNGSQYAAAFFNVSKINIALRSANFTSGAFTFSLSSQGQPLPDIGYNITINKLYRSSGTTSNGTISYSLPTGTPIIYGNVVFSIGMLSQQFVENVRNPPPVITIDKQYIELGIVAIVVFLMIVLVREPNRDEFYIDVPMLPEQAKTNITLQARDVLFAFDRLNMHYHWKYMPLSSSELRIAISNNLRYNNMSVNLTYSNVEAILNKLLAGGYVVSADDLYAPKTWLEQSNHDMEYLVTFKKLRLYLVTHSYLFTDIDTSSVADIVATLRNERKYIIIHSESMRFKSIPVYSDSKTYLAFINSERLEEFRNQLQNSMSKEADELKIYVSSGAVVLVDADNPSETLS
jgi:hypothetical protein